MSLLAGLSPTEAKSSADTTLDFVLFDSLAAAESAWRALEVEAGLTPYQRFDWLRALVGAGLESSAGITVALIRRHGRAVALLPLVVERRFGIATARMLGTHQSNCDWLMTLPDFAPEAAELRDLLARIGGEMGGIDLLTLFNQPAQWQGKANAVLALGRSPAASNFYSSTIGPTPVPYIEHRLVNKRRSNIKRSARRLEELHGPLKVVRINDAAALDQVHAAFIAQRAQRFEEMGVRNIFAEDAFMRFFRQLALDGFGEARPALTLHALYAGKEILATCWGTMAGSHYSQYINSTASGPAAKYSLMAVLIAEVMDDLTQSGITTFDMGLGDFDYKFEWTEPEPVFHSVVALTTRGRIAARLLELRAAIKRLVKQTPALWSIARYLRRQLLRLTRGS